MAEIETRVTTLEQQVSNVMTKLDMFIEESRAARQRQDAEMREARQKHDADMKEIREKHDADMHEMNQRFYNKFDDMNAKIDAKFASMDAKIDNMGQHVRNMSIVTIIGIAAMVVAVFLK